VVFYTAVILELENSQNKTKDIKHILEETDKQKVKRVKTKE